MPSERLVEPEARRVSIEARAAALPSSSILRSGFFEKARGKKSLTQAEGAAAGCCCTYARSGSVTEAWVA